MGGWGGGGGGGGSNLHAAGLALVAQQRLQQLVDRARLRSSAPYGYNKQPHHLTPSSSHTAEDAAAEDGRPVCSTMRSHAPLPFATRRQRAVSRSATCKRRLLSFCAPTQRATQACQSWAVLEHWPGAVLGDRLPAVCMAARPHAASGGMPQACLIDLRRLTEAGALGCQLGRTAWRRQGGGEGAVSGVSDQCLLQLPVGLLVQGGDLPLLR
jgi:hypothetical protein